MRKLLEEKDNGRLTSIGEGEVEGGAVVVDVVVGQGGGSKITTKSKTNAKLPE